MAKKKRFLVRTAITHASGERTYEVMATSFEDAVDQIKAGDIPVLEEDIQVEKEDLENAEDVT